MKTQVLGIAVFVTALLAVSPAVAQGKPGDVLVNVPFAFVAGSQQMPAGSYIVTPANGGFIRMYATQGSKSVYLGVHSVESLKLQEAKLIFHRYGAAYFLAQVWAGNGAIGRELPRSKAEKEIASGKLSGARSEGELAVVRPER